MESIKFQEAMKIAQIDAPQMSSDGKRYCEGNQFAYYVVCNTWCALAYDLQRESSDILSDQLLAKGLIAIIRSCATDADLLIQGTPEAIDQLSDLGRFLIKDLTLQESLQLLRYPKRFSPKFADKIEQQGIRAFKNVLNEVKMKSRREISPYLCAGLRNIIADICKGFSSDHLVDDGYFSSGAVQNTAKCLASKVKEWWFPDFLGIPISSKTPPLLAEFPAPVVRLGNKEPGDLKFNRKTADAKAVPKSYKAPRIIAEEESTRQWFLQAIRSRLEDCIKCNGYSRVIKLEDQSHNQRLAFEGTMVGYSTIDLSSASDRIAYALFATVFPKEVVDAVREWRSSTVRIDGEIYVAHMCATSGSAICFVIESILFYSIAQLATDIVTALTGEDLLDPSAYGDDIIVDDRAYDTACDLLEIFGFVVNTEKSFTLPSLYRESCGVEFYDGVECTTHYFPRKPISQDIKSLDSLIKLHNSMFEYWHVHVFLKRIIRSMVSPSLFTTSAFSKAFEEDPTDLYDPLDEVQTVLEPYGHPSTPDESHITEAHMVTRQVPDGKFRPVDEAYYYAEYLRRGPMYDDPLMELLKVSTSRVRREDGYAQFATIVALQADI